MAEFCAKAGVCPNIAKITGEQINQAWRDVVEKRLDIASQSIQRVFRLF
ncbi:MAG: hypothetical protein PUB35_01140 [Campylobacteraceae bacterium]|nr:hypothetical protein [Campylobacteraceae bacterium]